MKFRIVPSFSLKPDLPSWGPGRSGRGEAGGEGWSTAGWLRPPGDFNAGRPRAAILFCLLLVVLLFLARFIVVVYVCLVCNFSIVATSPSIQLPALLFVCVLFLLFVDVLSGESEQGWGRGLVGRGLVQASR